MHNGVINSILFLENLKKFLIFLNLKFTTEFLISISGCRDLPKNKEIKIKLTFFRFKRITSKIKFLKIWLTISIIFK